MSYLWYLFLIIPLSLSIFNCSSRTMKSRQTIPQTAKIIEKYSNHDSVKFLLSEPALVYNCHYKYPDQEYPSEANNNNSAIKLSLKKSTQMPVSDIVLEAIVDWYEIPKSSSLHFFINGEQYKFSAIENYYGKNSSYLIPDSVDFAHLDSEYSKKYIITLNFLKKLLSAQDVWVRVDIVNQEISSFQLDPFKQTLNLHFDEKYVKGEFSRNGRMSALRAFNDFHERILSW